MAGNRGGEGWSGLRSQEDSNRRNQTNSYGVSCYLPPSFSHQIESILVVLCHRFSYAGVYQADLPRVPAQTLIQPDKGDQV
jgi:hypothetical protein